MLFSTYGFEGSETDLRDAGALAVPFLSAVAARIALLACLGAGLSGPASPPRSGAGTRVRPASASRPGAAGRRDRPGAIYIPSPMRASRLPGSISLVAIAWRCSAPRLTGCGQASATHTPDLAGFRSWRAPGRSPGAPV